MSKVEFNAQGMMATNSMTENELNALLSLMDNRQSQLQADLSAAQSELAVAQSQLQAAEQAYEAAKADYEAAMSEPEDPEKPWKKAARVAAASARLDAAQLKVAQCQTRVSNLQTKIAGIQSNISTLAAGMSSLQASKGDAQAFLMGIREYVQSVDGAYAQSMQGAAQAISDFIDKLTGIMDGFDVDGVLNSGDIGNISNYLDASLFNEIYAYDGVSISQYFGGISGHYGIDIKKPGGTSVMSIMEGKIIAILKDGNSTANGNMVLIEHVINGVTFYSHYSHLQDDSYTVEVGDAVHAGQEIASVGNTGYTSRGDHIHLGIYTSDNIRLRPAGYFSDAHESEMADFSNYSDAWGARYYNPSKVLEEGVGYIQEHMNKGGVSG